MKRLLCLAAMLVCLATGARAAEGARVEAVQAPAWLERGGAVVPIVPGMALAGGDRVRTGTDARVYLQLGEGSRVKLGEHARFEVESAGLRSDGVFGAALRVVTGAFRFTTGVLSRARAREVSIRVATITAGVRGTDLWGKSTDERDLVCLLEGRISVSHAGAAETTLTEPTSFFIAPRGAPPLPVGKVDAAQVRVWAAETEIAAGAGATRSGPWRVALAEGLGETAAFDLYLRARQAGYGAALQPRADAPGRHRYDVVLPGLDGLADGRALAGRVARDLGLGPLRVLR